MKILSGSAHPLFANRVAKAAKTVLGKIEIRKFPNGEKRVHVLEKIKGELVFIIQPTISDEDIIELCLIVDAAKRIGAKQVIGVTPWLGYSPQDEIYRPGEPLSAKVIAQILAAAGVDEVMIVDPHSSKIKRFFTVPITLISGLEVFVKVLKKKSLKNVVVAALDLGDMERGLKISQRLHLPLVLLQKTPRNRETGQVEFMGIKGRVKGKNVLVFDDFVSTGQTLIKAAEFVKKEGAKKFTACVTHYLPVKGLAERLQKSKIDKIFVSDTLPMLKGRLIFKMKVLSVAPLIAREIENLVK